MYNNSYLGAGNGVPGQQQQQQQQQQGPFGGGASPFGQQQPQPQQPQPTGFGQAPLQNQYTGYPGLQPQPTGMPQPMPGQLQNQYTGYPGLQAQATGMPQQTGFQSAMAPPPMPSIPAQYQQQANQNIQTIQQQQPQQTSSPFASAPGQGFSAPAPAPSAPMKPQPTGFQEMAASFQTGGGAAHAPAAQASQPPRKIPNIRLSFITAADQSKFETLFTSAVGDGQTMTGEKARDLLMRSRLDGDSLSHIWTLADTTRSGQLHFPEFALAMYLCNLKMTGKTLPATLPANIKNEVSSMVDIINFNVADDGASAPPQSQSSAPTIHQPQPQPQVSNSQLLQATMTGYGQQQQQPSFMNQQTGLQSQQTGFAGMQAQPTGYAGPRPPMPPMPPMPTGFGGNNMSAPLNAQPTGRPGQWGLVNTPSTGLPNMDTLQARMMPQTGRDQGSFTTAGLQGNAQIPWAITKGEKTTYDAIFRAWDGMNKGYIAGSQAIEVFGQSGLDKADLERVWTLADHGNKGRLNLDEFAVAMHLIYRKLNGYPVPARLPAELIPPSTRNFSESLDTLKNLVNQESDHRKNSGAALLPQKTGVSYLKSHSFRGSAGAFGNAQRKDGTVFKNDDEAVGYRSSARRRIGGAGNDSPRTGSPAGSTGSNHEDLTLDQLRKKVKEKQVVLDALDFKDERNAEEDDILDRRDRREADELYRRIRRVQEDIDGHPNAALVKTTGNSDAERRTLKRQLQTYTDKIPALASQVRKTEKAIADARLELFRIKDAKAHPSSGEPVIGTGPGGAVTESDRVKARAKALMRKRTAALRGETVDADEDSGDAAARLADETTKVRREKEANERMVADVEESVRAFAAGIEESIKDTGDSTSYEHEKRRWEDALGVEDEVRDFIFDLQRSSRATRVRAQESRVDGSASSPAPTSAPTSTPTPTSYSSYKTPEERAAYIKEQAAQRMQERLAALGIGRRGESAAQRSEREKSERAEKARLADEETARRDAERKARLAEEQGIPPPAAAATTATPTATETKQPPPPPAVRKAAPAPAPPAPASPPPDQDDELASTSSRLKELEEQVRQSKLRKEEEKRKKKAAQAEAKEREAKLAARRAEIEAARKREEELRRQLESMDDDSSSDDEGPEQITPPDSSQASNSNERPEPAEPESAEPESVEPESRNPYFKMMTQPAESSPVPSTVVTPPTAPAPPTPAPPAPPAPAPAPADSTNPFHRMTVNPIAAAPLAPMPTGPVSRKRADTDDDGWGSDNDDDEEEDSDDDRPGGKSAAELASRLFGSMAPPRPLSSSPAPAASPTVPPPVPPPVPTVPTVSSPVPAESLSPESSSTPFYDAPSPAPPAPSDAPSAPPPPPPGPPPPPVFGAPTGAPPPPPPPPPPGGAPGGPPPPPPPPPPGPPPPSGGGGGLPAGFLGQVQAGRALRKTTTVDKSTAAVAGRVLD